ncbi:MAG: DNA repair exonuclease [Methanobrevibacter sp.]|jgi:DNA repair exonuclease SbcCD nuclease subunit|nr:DNA repair exonuclease [Methanobrevibacter sp.]
MKFAHIADNHLGYSQYGLYPREEDVFEAFKENIDKIIEERVDFVIHSGDLFEMAKPSPHVLLVFQEALLKLKNANIDVFAIAGNHDIVMRRNTISPQYLSKNLGLKLIDSKNPYYIYKDIFIGGITYHSKPYKDDLINSLKNLSKQAENYERRILLLHQGIDKFLPWQYELELDEIPKNFNYYACGHVHNRIMADFGDGKLAYPGSTEILKKNEVIDYKKNGKGFYLVDISGNIPEIEAIDVKPKREFIVKIIQYPNLDNDISNLKREIKDLDKPPILNLLIEGGNFSKSDVLEVLNNELSDLTLTVKTDFDIVSLRKNNIGTELSHLSANDLLKKYLSEFANEDIDNLAMNLLDKLSKDKIGDGKRIAAKFYKQYFERDI